MLNLAAIKMYNSLIIVATLPKHISVTKDQRIIV